MKKTKARDEQAALRQHLLVLLRGENAHINFERVIRGMPADLYGRKPPGAAHTPWQLLEHLRIAQWDILEFSRKREHVSPEFPSGYWPEGETPPNAAAWEKTVQAFRADLKAVEKLVADPKTDLFAKIPHGTGQSILREALLVADHNAYHLGQLLLLRRLLGAWPEK